MAVERLAQVQVAVEDVVAFVPAKPLEARGVDVAVHAGGQRAALEAVAAHAAVVEACRRGAILDDAGDSARLDAPGAPHLVLHADTTPANVHDVMRIEAIHATLAAKGLTPAEHLVDSAYISAEHLVRAREQHGIDLVGPGRPRTGWQTSTEGAFDKTNFIVDWERQVARCAEGRSSTSWRQYPDQAIGPYIRARFTAADCNPCPSKPRCTRGHDQGRQLRLNAHEQHQALAATRARGDTEAGRRLYAQRQGIEGTISQGVRSFGLRQARYRGLAKTGLQNVATAAAINLDRLAAWLAKRPLAATRKSRFAAMAAWLGIRQRYRIV